MDDIFTFNDKDNKFLLSVKSSFLEKCPDPHTFNTYDLNNDYYMFKYLHNPNGPAVVRFRDGYEDYWVDGVCLNRENPEQMELIKKRNAFKERLAEAIV